ncbi:hypothetical protein [Rhodanobacter glycinis]|uniref:Lipoprotein n=1 Tax=Rhodanobacter glycinis TaxID=582702 RepID=A0A1I3XTY1_9GAMM|nr:hypothetical protein [Rhodanobacter glycinis]SFK23005.1 hypothetical protein SAMN05192579_101157 [Rhodanobacter glycinis]
MNTILKLALACAGAASLSACISTQSYVGPASPMASTTALRSLSQPIPVKVNTQFQVNGKASPAGTPSLQAQVESALRSSGVFTPSQDPATAASITVTVNDTVDLQAAHKKGFHAGLTLGSSGTVIPDNYTYTASYANSAGEPYQASYKQDILTAIGSNVQVPVGVKATTPGDAFHRVILDMTTQFVQDLQTKGLVAER